MGNVEEEMGEDLKLAEDETERDGDSELCANDFIQVVSNSTRQPTKEAQWRA